MTRSVEDGAVILSIIAGRDSKDNYTSTAPSIIPDYTKYLDVNAIKGKRFGVPRAVFTEDRLTGNHPYINIVFNKSLETIRSLGGIIVDPADLPSAHEVVNAKKDEVFIASVDFKIEVNRYLGSLKSIPSRVSTIAKLIAYNDAHKDLEEPKGYEDQSILVVSQSMAGYNSTYYAALQANYDRGRTRGIDAALRTYQLDAIVLPSNGWTACPAAAAGYPIVTVPLGFFPNDTKATPIGAGSNTVYPAPGAPFGLAFLGTAYSEPSLIGFAYAYEQKTRTRLERRAYAAATPKTQLKDVISLEHFDYAGSSSETNRLDFSRIVDAVIMFGPRALFRVLFG
ncbi:hypothetical protein FRC12_001844 [Ceratobasidium sp. 428]|nr:hypothetical protein FRC12_001844 [Ceratobasidium sp. 428]